MELTQPLFSSSDNDIEPGDIDSGNEGKGIGHDARLDNKKQPTFYHHACRHPNNLLAYTVCYGV